MSCLSSSTFFVATCLSSARDRAFLTRSTTLRPITSTGFSCLKGITGLWQVTARANASYGEALDMDVAYVRSWSLGLDLRLLLRTPLQVLRQRSSTA